MPKTIKLSDFIYEKLKKQNLNIENPLKSAAVHFLLTRNILAIFGTDEFLSEKIDTIILEEKNENVKARFANLTLKHEGIEYKLEMTNEPSILFISPSTIPFFEISIEPQVIKNKIMYKLEEETVLEKQEINCFEKKYYHQKQNLAGKESKKVAFSLQPMNCSHRGLEQFELINEECVEEESVYWLERIFNNLKKNNIRKIPYGENEVKNLTEIFDCLERECANDKRVRRRTLD